MWNHKTNKRPEFAEIPREGQESVWDYPRPPALLSDQRLVQVRAGDLQIAVSRRTYRVCETASPPTFYIPPDGVDLDLLNSIGSGSYCEWKGSAHYWTLSANPGGPPVAWSYPRPRAAFMKLKGLFSFYPGRVECYIDGERVLPQPGGFYGGWITREVRGPFKGEPGTGHW